MPDPTTPDPDDEVARPASGTATAEQRGSYLGFVAHEMRNPLSTALWSAELLARLTPEERAGARGEKLSGMCLRSLQRLRLLVEDHFMAERLQVGGIPVRLEAIPWREAVETAAGKAGAGELTTAGEELAVSADRGLLERALEGVLAVAGRGKAPVSVDVARSGGQAVIRLRGAPPEADALQPPQKGTASDPTGRALALHTAAGVARALGGLLSATAEEYVLTLPVAAAGAAPGTAP